MRSYTFLWKGTDKLGTVGHVRIEAQTAQEARGLLTDQGWTGLELLTDEIASSTGAGMQEPEWKANTPLTADQEAMFFEGKEPGMFAQWFDSLKRSWLGLLMCGGLVAWGFYRGTWIPWTVGVAGILVFVLMVPAFHIFFSIPMRLYDRLLAARVWGRWDEVFRCVDALRRSHRLTRIGVGEVELVRSRAQALAALGRLEDGLAEMESVEHLPELPRWLYLSHLGAVYDVAEAFEESLECRRQATEEKPDSNAVWTDLAYGYVRRLNRPVEAREALARAAALEMTGLARKYMSFLRGLIEWREGDWAAAAASFREAIANFQNLTPANELVKGLALLSKAHLCTVERKQGNHEEAAKLFSEVEEFLVANRETELLQLCRG